MSIRRVVARHVEGKPPVEVFVQYLLLIYEDEGAWSRFTEAQRNDLFGAYRAFTSELRGAGVMLGGDALQPTASATTVRVRAGKTTTTDGPFAETKEQLGGFYMIDVPDLDEALKWAAKIPSAAIGSIEVRPVLDYSREPGT